MAKARKTFNRVAAKLGVSREEGLIFINAAKDGDLETVKDFVCKYGAMAIDLRDCDWSPPNEPPGKSDQHTALMHAVWARHGEIVDYLIAEGANVNARDRDGYTPLMFAHDTWTAAALLDAGAKIDQKNNEGATALMWPTTVGMIRFLAARGANIEARDKQGKTALIRVAEGNYARGEASAEGNMAALLECGANIDARDAKGRTALMNAAVRSAYEDNTFDIISFLLKRKANPHLKDAEGKNAAMLAQAALLPVDPHRTGPPGKEELEDLPQVRVSKLLERVCAEQQEKMARDCTDGTRRKIAVSKPLRLKRGKG